MLLLGDRALYVGADLFQRTAAELALQLVVGVLNLGGFWQTAPGVTQGLEVTNFDENGAGLTATYDLQMSDVLNPARTATMRGTLQIAFPVGTP